MVRFVASDRPSVPPESSVLPDNSMARRDETDQTDVGNGDNTGLMILRAWMEPGSKEPLRVRIRLTTDVSKDFQRTMTISDVDAVCSVVEGWLMDILAEATSPD